MNCVLKSCSINKFGLVLSFLTQKVVSKTVNLLFPRANIFHKGKAAKDLKGFFLFSSFLERSKLFWFKY